MCELVINCMGNSENNLCVSFFLIKHVCKLVNDDYEWYILLISISFNGQAMSVIKAIMVHGYI